MSTEINDDKLIEKVFECIMNEKIKSKNDLKLFGIIDEKLQKEIVWSLFEEQMLNASPEEKTKVLNRFRKLDIL